MTRFEKSVYFFLAALVWVYVAFRAWLVPFAHDEIATFFHYVQVEKFLPFNALYDANNHFLNSLLTYFSFKLFGSHQFFLRLPNLLISFIYFLYLWKIGKHHISKTTFRWSFFIIMLFSHYLIEYFGYSRGYGLMSSFLMATLYYFIHYIKENNKKHFWLLNVFLLLSFMSSLTIFFFSILLIMYVTMVAFYKRTHHWVYTTLNLLFWNGIFICAYIYFKILDQNNQLYLGENTGIWEVSVKSFLKCFVGYDNGLAQIIFAILLILWVVIMIKHFLNLKYSRCLLKIEVVFFLLFMGSVVSYLLANFLLDVNFPTDRAVIYVFPVLVLGIVLLMDKLEQTNTIVYLPILILLITPITFPFLLNFTHYTYIDFTYDRFSGRFIQTIINKSNSDNYLPTVSGYKMRHFVYNYYNYQMGGYLPNIQYSDYPSKISDFQIVDTTNLNIDFSKYDIIDKDEVNSYFLLERKNMLRRNLIQEIRVEKITNNKNEFFEFYNDTNCTRFLNKNLLLEYDIKLSSEKNPFKSWVVISIFDKKNEPIVYEYYPLNWSRYSWDKNSENLKTVIYVSDIPSSSYKLVT
mgnify:FL=1